MKKKNVLKIAALAAMLPLASCFKDDVDPVSGKNSVLKVNNIAFQNLTTTQGTSLQGFTRFDFYIANGANGEITDTTTMVDSFYITNPEGYTQTYDFDTPEKAKKMRFIVSFIVKGNGTASSVNVSSLYFKKNETIYLDEPMTFTTTDNKLFLSEGRTVNF